MNVITYKQELIEYELTVEELLKLLVPVLLRDSTRQPSSTDISFCQNEVTGEIDSCFVNIHYVETEEADDGR